MMKILYLILSFYLMIFQQMMGQDLLSEKLTSVKNEQNRRIEVIKKISPSVVCIFGLDPAMGGGSGVLIHPAGYAVTNFHVVNPVGLNGKGGLNDGKLYDLETLGIDPGGDIAIVKLSGKNKFDYATMRSHRTLSIGDFCMALGNPFLLADDFTPTVTFGVVSGLNRYQYGVGRTLVYGDCIQIDSSINPGNSGGPLFNDDGYVVGINGRGSFEERGRVNVGLGYAISSLQIIKFLPDLFSTKICLHGTLNAKFKTKNDGVYCYELNPNGNSFRAGLKAGDKLISLDGLPITHSNTLVNYISTYPADWPIHMTIERAGEVKSIWIRLDELEYGEVEEGEDQKKSVFGEIGKIRDQLINSREANRILSESGALLNFDKKVIQEVTCNISKSADDKTVGYHLRISGPNDMQITDLKESKEYKFDALLDRVYFNESEVKDGFVARQLLEAAQPIVQWYMMQKPEGIKSNTLLVGGDLAQGRPSFKIQMDLELNDKKSNLLYYFDVMSDEYTLVPKLLKAAILEAGVVSNYGFLYKEFFETSVGIRVPSVIHLVRGYEEKVILTYSISEVKIK